MSWIGDAVAPASVLNWTERTDLVVVNGFTWADFYHVGPEQNSSDILWSIDALGGYRRGVAQRILYRGRLSSWWKIPSGTTCYVVDSTYGVPMLVVTSCYQFPQPSTAKDWHYQG
jgi:hypothetical protein